MENVHSSPLGATYVLELEFDVDEYTPTGEGELINIILSGSKEKAGNKGYDDSTKVKKEFREISSDEDWYANDGELLEEGKEKFREVAAEGPLRKDLDNSFSEIQLEKI